jgi:glycosyltransferase involved in cell wall biosynthesis
LSFGEYWNSFVLLSLFGTPWNVYVSDRSQPDKSLGRMHNLLRKWLYKRATGVILQTEKAREIYKRSFNRLTIHVIGNPIRHIAEYSDAKKMNQVLMVGRLIKTKNQDRLIRMFADIGNKDWKLVLVGYDHLKQANLEPLKKLAADCGIEDRVDFAGKQYDVERYYRTSKIFAFTSSSEGFPNVIGEAMAAGLPVVAYDCMAGPSEMIRDNENGFLVPLYDDEQFKSKLSILMEDEDLREVMGRNARLSIERFKLEHIGKKYLDVITN